MAIAQKPFSREPMELYTKRSVWGEIELRRPTQTAGSIRHGEKRALSHGWRAGSHLRMFGRQGCLHPERRASPGYCEPCPGTARNAALASIARSCPRNRASAVAFRGIGAVNFMNSFGSTSACATI